MSLLKLVKLKINKLLHRNSAVILCYHGVYKNCFHFPLFTKIQVQLFEEQIGFLADNYNCVSLSQLKKQLRNNRVAPNTIVLTFDDGFANNYSVAFPVLKKYKMPATIFVVAGLIDTPYFIWNDQIPAILAKTREKIVEFDEQKMSINTTADKEKTRFYIISALKKKSKQVVQNEIVNLQRQLDVIDDELYNDVFLQQCFGMLAKEQIKEMHGSGLIEIGSHGMDHFILSRLSNEESIFEINQSKKVLEVVIENPVTSYAYPNGTINDFTEFHKRSLSDAGYDAVLTTISDRVSQDADLLQLPRYCVPGSMDISGFRYLLTH